MPQLDASLHCLGSGKLMHKPVVLTYQATCGLPHGLIHAIANSGLERRQTIWPLGQ